MTPSSNGAPATSLRFSSPSSCGTRMVFMSFCPRFVNTCPVNGRSGAGSLSNSIPLRVRSISSRLNRK